MTSFFNKHKLAGKKKCIYEQYFVLRSRRVLHLELGTLVKDFLYNCDEAVPFVYSGAVSSTSLLCSVQCQLMEVNARIS